MIRKLVTLDTPIERLLTLDELIEITRWSESSARKRIAEGVIRPIQFSKRGKYYFRPSDVRELLDRHAQ